MRQARRPATVLVHEMVEFFNPAGLDILEDRSGAIAYGFLAPRVLYARLVGSLSAELGTSYVCRLELSLRGTSKLAYFADCSALRDCGQVARLSFVRCVRAHVGKLSSAVLLGPSHGGGSIVRVLARAPTEPVAVLTDPSEFDHLLSNVVPATPFAARSWGGEPELHPPSV